MSLHGPLFEAWSFPPASIVSLSVFHAAAKEALCLLVHEVDVATLYKRYVRTAAICDKGDDISLAEPLVSGHSALECEPHRRRETKGSDRA